MAKLCGTFVLQRCILLEEAVANVEVPTQISTVVVFFACFTSRSTSSSSQSYRFACVCIAPSWWTSIQLWKSQVDRHLARITRRQPRRNWLHTPGPCHRACVTRRMFPHRTSDTIDSSFCALGTMPNTQRPMVSCDPTGWWLLRGQCAHTLSLSHMITTCVHRMPIVHAQVQ